MIYFHFILFYFLILTSHLVENASSLHVEGINNGYFIRQREYTYQAAILIRDRSFFHQYKLICSGSVISKDLVLSIAQCFVNDDGSFIKYSYSITCSTRNWFYDPGTVVLIEKIYFPDGGSYHYMNNVAVSKLMASLNVINNPYLSVVNIPYSTEPFYGKEAHVTGYGYSWVSLDWSAELKSIIRVAGGSDHWLQGGDVLVRREVNCKSGNRSIHPERYICGESLPSLPGLDDSGICDDDLGSPLVIDNQVLGLAVAFRNDCDDSIDMGNGYIKVSYFAQFINSIINETPLPNAFIHYNVRTNLTSSVTALAAAAA